MLDVIFDDTSLASDYGFCLSKRPIIPTPKRKVISTDIEGRDGSLTEIGDFEDIVIPLNFNVLENENIKKLTRRFKAFALDIKKLKFNDEMDIFYKVKNLSLSDFENEIAEYGEFDISARLDPFSYMESETVILTNATSIFNQGTYLSLPVIKVFGSGDITVSINNTNLVLKDIEGYITIDSDMRNALKDTEAQNDKMYSDFPKFIVGENAISWIGNVTKLEIEPNWRYL